MLNKTNNILVTLLIVTNKIEIRQKIIFKKKKNKNEKFQYGLVLHTDKTIDFQSS